jgi:hypothetical protein
MSRVTDEAGERNDLTRWIERLADELELRDWRITVSEEPPPPGVNGRCRVAYGRKVCTLQIDWSLPRDDLKHAVVHELLHPHFEAAKAMVEHELEHLLGAAADRAFFLGFRRNFETGIDAVATALVNSLEDPPL